MAGRARSASQGHAPEPGRHGRGSRGAPPVDRRPRTAPARSTRSRTQRSIQRTHAGGRMNALALKNLETDDLLPPRRVANAYLTEIRYELTRILRNPALAIPMMV